MKVEFDYPCDLKELNLGPEKYSVTAEVTNDGECYVTKVMLLINGQDINVESLVAPDLREVLKDEATSILYETTAQFRKSYRHVEHRA